MKESFIDPVSALRRVAFLLERAREDSYKIRAYRAAAAAISPLSEADLRTRAASRTLTELPGVGATTATLIAESLSGAIPTRLTEIEVEYGGDLAEGGHQLRAALRGDLHTHSDWSDGSAPFEEMALTAAELGHDYLVLTDHSPRLKIARGLSAARLRAQSEAIAAFTSSPLRDRAAFRLVKGIEVDILDDGRLDQSEEMLASLDLRVASIHSKLSMEPAAMTARMLAAVRNPFTNVLGHCTGRLMGGQRGVRPESRFDAVEVFAACAQYGVAVEINARPERRDPPTRLLELAHQAGCLFAINSDAHAPGQLDLQIYGCERAEELGIVADRIVNTWPIHSLLSWARHKV